MAGPENLGSFIKENKVLAKSYLDMRLEIYRLKMVRFVSRTGGYFIWIMISMFLLTLLALFTGLVIAFWLSDLTGSYIKGFGFTALIILLFIIVLAALRNVLFVNPIIRKIIAKAHDDDSKDNDQLPTSQPAGT